MNSLLKKLSVLILTAITCLTASNSGPSRAVAQQPVKNVSLPGLHGSVTVRRDERGIPYIEATDDLDLLFAQGYVTAIDRLWQIDVQRRGPSRGLCAVFCPAPLWSG